MLQQRGKYWVWGAAFGIICFFLFLTVIRVNIPALAAPAGQIGSTVGFYAPDFSLSNLSNQTVNLKQVVAKNRVTVLNFWTTWCPPCRYEMPDLAAFYDEYDDLQVELLAVNLRESRATALDFARNNSLVFPILLDHSGWVGRAYLVRYIPTTLLLDRYGKVRYRFQGAIDQYTLTVRVKELLRER